ncbi:MAG: EAL domain-containing protein [Synergistaceae bacterium]|jgi:diguanylate cyclase (GGDEF)-like protein/PAS domain S-box-containing protein|nr:EAL domain-containing protein [Synergistaceae bacterium]
MSLLKKFLYSVLGLLVVLWAPMTFNSGRAIFANFEAVEKRIFVRDMNRFDKYLQVEKETLLQNAVDLAAYNPALLEKIFAAGEIHILPIQMIALLDFSTGTMKGYQIDAAGRRIPVSPAFSQDLTQSIRRIYGEETSLFPVSGLLKIDEKDFIVGITPVPTHERQDTQSVIVVGESLEKFLAPVFRVLEGDFQLLDPEQTPPAISPQELSQITDNPEHIGVAFVSDKEAVVYYSPANIFGQRDKLFVHSNVKRLVYKEVIRTLANRYVWIVLLSSSTLILVLVVFDKLILSRVKKLQKIADDISYKWQVHLRIPLEGNDEITCLSRSFNTMLMALDELISNVPDPLILCGADGAILLANASTRELLGCQEGTGLVQLPFDSIFIEKEKTAGPGDGLLKDEENVFEATMRRCDGSLIPVEIHQATLTFGSNAYTLSIARDLTERKVMEARLVKMAFYDSQTGLPNRHYFLDELEKELRNIKTIPYYAFCVVFVNMDKFKLVNEQMGPRGADQVIVKVAERISGITMGFASVFRLSGDEFGIIIRGTNSREYVRSLLQRIQHMLNIPVSIDGKTVFPSASFGVVLDIQASNTSSQILSWGTDALIKGKKRGIGTITFLTSEESTEESKHHQPYNILTLQASMQRALLSSEFVAYFQPICQLSSRLAGFEALVRWIHPKYGVLSPGAFIPQAEETGFITEIDKSVISQAIRTAKKWSADYPEISFFISANASGASFKDPGFVHFVCDRIQEEDLDPRYFVLEVTEGIFIESLEAANAKLKILRDFGVKIALDDFGTGYSSLQYMSQLPINYIKIDKSFIDQLFLSEKNSLMVRSIINMARDLNFDVVAEGVENKDQIHWLEESKCSKGQGYFFSCPLPSEEAENLLADAKIFEELRQEPLS